MNNDDIMVLTCDARFYNIDIDQFIKDLSHSNSIVVIATVNKILKRFLNGTKVINVICSETVPYEYYTLHCSDGTFLNLNFESGRIILKLKHRIV